MCMMVHQVFFHPQSLLSTAFKAIISHKTPTSRLTGSTSVISKKRMNPNPNLPRRSFHAALVKRYGAFTLEQKAPNSLRSYVSQAIFNTSSPDQALPNPDTPRDSDAAVTRPPFPTTASSPSPSPAPTPSPAPSKSIANAMYLVPTIQNPYSFHIGSWIHERFQRGE
ncbi:hypothetical protein ABW19_dt0206631 [Dactylella cylindrospora]|nr:hypothetical protein ABW19_dt0206631 [Dactylella cylindrospora]